MVHQVISEHTVNFDILFKGGICRVNKPTSLAWGRHYCVCIHPDRGLQNGPAASKSGKEAQLGARRAAAAVFIYCMLP
jgi:hypothetical protein